MAKLDRWIARVQSVVLLMAVLFTFVPTKTFADDLPTDLPPKFVELFQNWAHRGKPTYFLVSRDLRQSMWFTCEDTLCTDDGNSATVLRRCKERLGQDCVIVGERGNWVYKGTLGATSATYQSDRKSDTAENRAAFCNERVLIYNNEPISCERFVGLNDAEYQTWLNVSPKRQIRADTTEARAAFCKDKPIPITLSCEGYIGENREAYQAFLNR